MQMVLRTDDCYLLKIALCSDDCYLLKIALYYVLLSTEDSIVLCAAIY